MTLSTLSAPDRGATPHLVALSIVLVWGVGIMALASTGTFQQAVSGPPLRIVLAIALPLALFLVAWQLSPALRAWGSTLDLGFLVGVQTFRVLGIVFIFAYFLGHLPTVFAFAAGLGDVAVGVLALAVTLAVVRRSTGWQRQTRWLIILGMLDFALAVGTATLSGVGGPLLLPGDPTAAAMQSLPMVMIPAWGVPLFIILLILCWIRLRQTTQD